jgi:hypothetical protein
MIVTQNKDKIYIERQYGWLTGKTIKKIRPLTPTEVESYGWEYGSEVPFVILFNDGSWIMPVSDDEGNNAGALFTYDYNEKGQR